MRRGLLLLAALALIPNAFSQTPLAAPEAPAEDFIKADRPGVSFGSSVIGPHRYQLEVGFQGESRFNGDDRRFFIPTLFRAGLSTQWELRVESTGAFSNISAGGNSTSGYGPTSIGAKYHWQDSKGIKHPSLGALVRYFPMSGSSAFSTVHNTGDIQVAADWDLSEKISLNPNLGIGFYEDGNGISYTTGMVALTVNYNPTSILNFFVNGATQFTESRDGKAVTVIDAGTAYLLNRNTQLDFSVGTGIQGQTAPHPFVAAGISVRF